MREDDEETNKQETHFSRSIDDGNKLAQVSRNKGVIQNPVLISQALQERVLLKITFLRFELIEGTSTLLVESIETMRQSSCKTKGSSFLDCKCSPYQDRSDLLLPVSHQHIAYLC